MELVDPGWITAIRIFFLNDNLFFVNTGPLNPDYYSTDMGNTWIESSVEKQSLTDYHNFSNGETIFCGSKGNITIHNPIPSGIKNLKKDYKGSFLYQNFPNPCNPSTQISFYIDHSAYVSLRLYTVLGQHVGLLYDQHTIEGYYTILPGTIIKGLSSGVYFYTLFTDNIPVSSKKMILMK